MKTNYFKFFSILALILCFSLASCGKKRKTSESFSVVKEYYDNLGVIYYLDLKNITNTTLNGSFQVKVKCKDGISETKVCFVNNMEPGDTQKVSIYNNSQQLYNVASWAYVE